MGGSLGPVLANITHLTEFERIIIDPLISSVIIKFYCRYVDDTLLLLIKHDDIDMLLHRIVDKLDVIKTTHLESQTDCLDPYTR